MRVVALPVCLNTMRHLNELDEAPSRSPHPEVTGIVWRHAVSRARTCRTHIRNQEPTTRAPIMDYWSGR